MNGLSYEAIRITPEEALTLVEQHYGLTGELTTLPGEIDFNFRLRCPDQRQFTVKISRPGENRHLVDLQLQAPAYIHQQGGFPLDLPWPQANLAGEWITPFNDQQGGDRLLRLVHWVEGQVYARAKPHGEALWRSLGEGCGHLSRALQGFMHPAGERFQKWDPSGLRWTEAHQHLFQGEEASIYQHFLHLFAAEAEPLFPQLRRSLNYNDANDYNILVAPRQEGLPAGWSYQVSGFIDFGDALYTHTVNELAIALAYALMDQGDPLSAARTIVAGYHAVFPLTDLEVQALFPLTAARLLISVTNSAINKAAEPENTYLQISEKPAWTLLRQLATLSPAYVHYALREACGWPAHPQAPKFAQWAARQQFAPLTGFSLAPGTWRALDLTVGSLDLGHNQHFEDDALFRQRIEELLIGYEAGLGGYGEIRPFYTTDAYTVQGNEGPRWRTVHLGLDVWGPAGTPVYAPYPGRVHSFADNANDRDYGPAIMLEHTPPDGPQFYTLYGHLARTSLDGLFVGRAFAAGEQVATFGPAPENGNWPPHLHFQVMLDTLGNHGDYPGVGFPEEWPIWRDICPNPEVLAGLAPGSTQAASEQLAAADIQAIRRQHLAPNLSVSYQQPLHMVRGYGQYLYAADGRRYLDTVNNVPHVGHQHPRIVAAAQRQLAVLNTNTRYLHTNIVRYAEEMLATLPAELDVIFFVNSGSEANELALRLARNYTGAQDILSVAVGYHGNTGACVDISAYKFDRKGGKGAPPTTHVVPLPDTYRGLYREADAGARYAAHLNEHLNHLQEQNRAAAAFICEGIISCGGQIVLPPGYLPHAFQAIRQAGGLAIVDEVQTGMGRVGDAFWAFELQGVVPDIVVMGKPIGNGHPLGAVACRRDIAEAFANGMEYFNTFGGNPVSCAIGREVLRVVQEENLQQQAREIGHHLKTQLQTLAQEFPIIGDVRGHGLFLGIELVTDPELRTPATDQATYLANRMRHKGILMSTDGPDENVLKIKPPLCFNRRNADMLLDTLREVLREGFLAV